MISNTLWITPNQRLKHFFLQQYHQQQQHHPVEKPLCFEYNEYLIYLLEALYEKNPKIPPLFLISSFNLRQWWRLELLKTQNLIYHEGLLDKLLSALTTCMEWTVDIHDPSFETTPQTRWFQKKYQRFMAYLKESQQLTSAHIPQYLNQYPSPLPEGYTLTWLCFDHLSPNQKYLQDLLSEKGHPSIHQDIESSIHTNSFLIEAADLEDEYSQLIEWSKQMLQDQQHIGIIVPDLQQTAPTLYNTLIQYIPEESINISFGKPLSHFPLIAHAIHLFMLEPSTLSSRDILFLLTSPYLILNMNQIDQALQCFKRSPLCSEDSFSIDQLNRLYPGTFSSLHDHLQHLPNAPTVASPSAWVKHFKTRLAYFGFPGAVALNSLQYQCLKKLDELFEMIHHLHSITTKLTEEQIRSIVLDYSKNTLFQPETTTYRPIQVLGLLEASGCTFDALWMVHLNQDQLPEKIQFSPFIPIELQKKLSMPKTDPIKELELAHRLIERFKKSAPLSFFSYSRCLEDKPQLPSPLIRHYPKHTIYYEKEHSTPSKIALYNVVESCIIPLPDHTQTTGGTNLIADQARCPFKAFATHRLKLKASPTYNHGLSSHERGHMLHQILEGIWTVLGDQNALLNQSPSSLEALLKKIIEEPLQQKARAHPHSFSSFIQTLERERLLTLCLTYLEWEKQRPRFKITQLEQKNTITLGSLTINVTFDRMDTLNNHKQWIIDYKSTLPSSKPWHNSSFEDPQLLIYALLSEQIEGLLFLEFKHGQLSCLGYSAEDVGIEGIETPKPPRTWTEEKERWRLKIHDLAHQFEQGVCQPNPISKKICTYCHLKSICRKDFEPY